MSCHIPAEKESSSIVANEPVRTDGSPSGEPQASSMHGHKGERSPSNTAINDTVGTGSAPTELDGTAEREEAQEDHAQNEPVIAEVDTIKPWTSSDPCICLPEEAKMTPEETWSLCAELALDVNNEKIARLHQKFNGILIFASLFSAVVTAFILESLKLVQVDHGEVAAETLLLILHRLDSIDQNATITVPPLGHGMGAKLPGAAIAVTILWLSSLALSLFTALVAIFCMGSRFESATAQRASLKQRAKPEYIVATMGAPDNRQKSSSLTLVWWSLSLTILMSLLFFTIGMMIFLFQIDLSLLFWPIAFIVALLVVCGLRLYWGDREPLYSTEHPPALVWGALQVAKTFSWDIGAIYAFIQSAEGMSPRYGKKLVRELSKSHPGYSPPLGAYFAKNLPKQGFDGLHADIFVTHVLDRFAAGHAQDSGLQPKLINHRFELLLRILNAAESYTPPHERPTQIITFLALPKPRSRVSISLSVWKAMIMSATSRQLTECRIQYCHTLWMYIQKVRIQRASYLLANRSCKNFENVLQRSPATHGALLKLLVPDLSNTPLWKMDSEVMAHVCALNQRMAQYVVPTSSQVSSETLKERIAKAIVYVAQIFDIISSGYDNALTSPIIKNYTETFPSYMNSIASLVENNQASEASVGALDDLVAKSDQDGWREFLKIYREHALGVGKMGRTGGDAVVHMA